MSSAFPRRGEIWTANLGNPPRRHWVLIVSLDSRNERAQSVLIVPFGSAFAEAPTILALEPGETGLPAASYLKGHFISTIEKAQLLERQSRALSARRMREICEVIRRSFDPDAPFQPRQR
jgi:mRNA-degrading endonuclease toxin of MazEF toxin-antitoxin module